MPAQRTYGFSKGDAEALVQLVGTQQVQFDELSPQGGRGNADTGRFVLTTSPTGGATGPTGAYMTATATIYKAETDGSVTSLATGVTLYLDYETFSDLTIGDYGPASRDARGKWIAVNAPCLAEGGSG
jgi:hypothetical protein